ncbi:5-methyltetrahydropteroyltriglutamate--homocysteine S-methyltransferase [Uliginosibacterium flavum]|uniref:5-methyltetrahydropteroyltriglutamate--homocysteine methyltransferase n=1 Tax=Uliginosibacterium flavum TaxID=1396831 RepID=A0ABV2TRW1_9RHOO
MPRIHISGFPRIGAQRELKFALESFWQGATPAAALENSAADLRARHWEQQQRAGLDFLCAGDFAFYDQMLDHCLLFGALPARFGFDAAQITLAEQFALARGNAAQPAMEMTKWFDTNYHYLVPELTADTHFALHPERLFAQIDAAAATGQPVKPTLIGPLTFLWLAKSVTPGFDRLAHLPALRTQYQMLLQELARRGVEWVQIDEPALALDLPPDWLAAFAQCHTALAACGPKILLASYFDSVAAHAEWLCRLPVHGHHIDLARAPEQLTIWQAHLPAHAVLSAGVIDGRNIWRHDLRATLAVLAPLHAALGERLWLAPSCSLQHVPVSLAAETSMDGEIRGWLAFASEKLDELRILARALDEGSEAVRSELDAASAALAKRRASYRVLNAVVRRRVAALTEVSARRHSPFAARQAVQSQALQLPALPTTSIGSFPQTPEIRQARAAHKRGEISALDYLQQMRAEVADAVARQEALGLDVLVHGEAERNDMVEFFGERLWGYVFSANGWVQSYGSRCVKPPIIYGDIHRPEAMTVEMTRYAQSLTRRHMKGMLTGPVTMLQWSFVRDDQPREKTALQLALAIRDEVAELEKAGIRIIQIDEPAFREGLPLKRAEQAAYLDWAARAFRISASPVSDATQIHTHMCYSEFNDILPAIAAMDADVITIETSRSRMELLDAFGEFDYPNEIGPGVYDIHSPRVPSVEEMLVLLERAAAVIPAERLWVNPDCGLKTRGWPETELALCNMVEAARQMRVRLAA